VSKSHHRRGRRTQRKTPTRVDERVVAASTQPKLGAFTVRGMKAYGELAAMDRMFKILYLVPHWAQDLTQASFFGWYTPGLHRAAGPLTSIAMLPADIREPFSAPEMVLAHRLTRRIWPLVTPIDLDALGVGLNFLDTPFRVFVSTEASVADEVDRLISQSRWPSLHASSIRGKGRALERDFNVGTVLEYCHAVLDQLATDPARESFVKSARAEMTGPRQSHAHPLPRGLHNVTLPNELALCAFGRTLRRVERISAPLRRGGNDPQRYVDRICRSADAVTEERARLIARLSPDLLDYRYIIAVQSIHWGHFGAWRERVAKFDGQNKAILRFAYAASVQATTYFDTIDESEKSLIESPLFRYVTSQKAADARAFTAGLGILASSSLAPVLRLEPRLNQIRGDLKQLACCVRTKGRHHFAWKQSRLVRGLSTKMRSLINESFLSRVDKPEDDRIEGLKLITDLPLELMQSGGLPLAMRFDVSRLPVMPGNLFLATCVIPPTIVPVAAFNDVLVIRSFRPDDPLRNLLEASISGALARPVAFQVKVRFVDVANEEELVTALTAFRGAVLIFDGHGSYDTDLGAGTLVIGGQSIDAWQLRKRCSIPPIVIFSACDTQPLDGSHSSVATAAFALGAHTVLATMLPIDGRLAALFIGRLLFRMAEFLPLAVKFQSVFTWREFIAGMLRMTYVTEVIEALRTNGGKAYHGVDFDEATLRANVAINNRRPGWFETFVNELSSQTTQSTDVVKSDIGRWASMTDSMKYVQLGNPESIVIVEENATDVFQEELRGTDSAE
jgi:hypothetical protein